MRARALARALALALALLAAAACGGNGVTSPPPEAGGPSPSSSPPLSVRVFCPDQQVAPSSLPFGATVAVMGTAPRELTLFQVDDASGCWIRLDGSEAPSPLIRLAVHPSGRFVFASGEVVSGGPGVAAYAIVRERAMIDGLGASSMEEHRIDRAGSLAVTDDAVYMLSGGAFTGYHGGMWRWSFDAGDGGLTWRGVAAPSRDPFFLVPSTSDARFLYLGTETLDNAGFGIQVSVLRIGAGGALNQVAATRLDSASTAVAAGHFLWIASPYRTPRLAAYAPGAAGALGPVLSTIEWTRPAPVAHPGGRVLYSASATEVEAYAVDINDGTPRLVAHVPAAGADPYRLAVHPSGRFLYLVTAAEVRAFRTDSFGHLEDHGRVAPGGGPAVLLHAR